MLLIGRNYFSFSPHSRSGTAALSIARNIMRLFGWRVEGGIADKYKKFVIIAAPHTSAWDFPLGVLARAAIGRTDIKYVGKKSLFKPPLGWVMKALGGYPVDRSTSHNLVDAIVDIFNNHDEFALNLAPEGTRKRVERFRTGFYYIAKGAGVPIFMVKFDYRNKVIQFDPEPFWPTEDAQADLNYLWNYFAGIHGKYPELSIHANQADEQTGEST